MKHMISLLLLTAVLLAAVAVADAGNDPATDTLVNGCRALVGEFQTTLKGELMKAMSEGGPANAINVCQVQAPMVANNYSQLNGWSIRRTALRTRNPENTAAPYEAAALQRLASDSLNELTEWVTDSAGNMQFHYLSAIRMAAPCLTCHGAKDQLSDDITGVLTELYPHDEAVDFKTGDLRGAFSITVDWPAGRAVADSLWLLTADTRK